MKKQVFYVLGLISISVATLILTPSCSKDELVPNNTLVGYSFPSSLSGTGSVYSNSSNNAAAPTTGSFYSFETKSSYPTATAKDNASFQFVFVSGSDYKLKNTMTTSISSLSGVLLTKGATFESTSSTYEGITAESVFSTTINKSEISISDGSVILFQTKGGEKGVLKATLTEDGGTPTSYKQLTFSYKKVLVTK